MFLSKARGGPAPLLCPSPGSQTRVMAVSLGSPRALACRVQWSREPPAGPSPQHRLHHQVMTKNPISEKLKLQVQLQLVTQPWKICLQQDGLSSVIILLKSYIFPLTFMVPSWLQRHQHGAVGHVGAGPGGPSFHKQAVIVAFIDP